MINIYSDLLKIKILIKINTLNEIKYKLFRFRLVKCKQRPKLLLCPHLFLTRCCRYTRLSVVTHNSTTRLLLISTHHKEGKKKKEMASLKVPASVPDPCEDAEQLKKAFKGFESL